MDKFKSNSVTDLQKYLRQRGVTYANTRKAELVDLCRYAAELNIEVDPDGLVEDRSEVLDAKLCVHGNTLVNPQLIAGTYDLSKIPRVSIFDIYNYLLGYDEFTHSTLRDYHKLEGYTMFRDGYVIDLTSASYDSPDYVALKGQVRSRVKDKDPLTKRKYYQCWLVITSEGCIHSAYCTRKGG
ncbi:uncharacterized protein LOC132725255 [Ruditapes philippinarum]|uniref:uncharacterized protein LOC132725255 n=1 Tax=Ruditapes philippinarum TaxID=129788 RepID=UPI00295ADEF0|nr:uncharacterized protein LOC132725255 [Ruditapes philippinarum]